MSEEPRQTTDKIDERERGGKGNYLVITVPGSRLLQLVKHGTRRKASHG